MNEYKYFNKLNWVRKSKYLNKLKNVKTQILPLNIKTLPF